MIDVVNEWDVDPVKTEYEDIERKIAELKLQLAQYEYTDLKLLKKEIQKLKQAKGNTKDRCLRQIRLGKLNRNLSVLKYVKHNFSEYIELTSKLS